MNSCSVDQVCLFIAGANGIAQLYMAAGVVCARTACFLKSTAVQESKR